MQKTTSKSVYNTSDYLNELGTFTFELYLLLLVMVGIVGNITLGIELIVIKFINIYIYGIMLKNFSMTNIVEYVPN